MSAKIFYVIGSKKKCWTNQAGREALGIQSGETVNVTLGSRTVSVQVSQAPASAARVMRATAALSGLQGLAITEYSRRELGIKPGEKVQVISAAAARQLPAVSSSTPPSTPPKAGKKEKGDKSPSLRDRMAAMPVGGILEVSASAAKSGAYSIAKDLGIKIKKVSDTSIKRVE